jgi:hypothetical protein
MAAPAGVWLRGCRPLLNARRSVPGGPPATNKLYEKEPAVKLGTSHLVSVQADLTARRTD